MRVRAKKGRRFHLNLEMNLIRFYLKPEVIVQALKSPIDSVQIITSLVRSSGFIRNLVDISSDEVQKYTLEIIDSDFRRDMAKKEAIASGGIGDALRIVLYLLVRKMKPVVILETGVASGISSAYFLYALENNKLGSLYSIDLPCYKGLASIPKGKESGWLIPENLRHRWNLIIGSSSERLLPTLQKLGTVDIFMHDSEHSYENMMYEFQTVWPYIREGGLLLSHDVNLNKAFSDFCKHKGRYFTYSLSLGGIRKSSES